jgi:hypothetical protein
MSATDRIRISDWRISVIAGTIFLLALMGGCGERTCTEPDTPFTEVTLTWPPDHSVIGGAVLVHAAVSDSELIAGIQFFADSLLLREDSAPPYDSEWDADAYPLGSTHRLWARAFDARGHFVSSETLTVHSQWLAMVEDDDDPWLGDVRRVYVRSSATVIELRMELDCASEDCMRDQDAWVLLDTDQNRATGCSASGNLLDPPPNDIGVDFGVCSGWLFAWGNPGCGWTDAFRVILPRFVFLEPNGIELAINLADIGDPAVTDIVVTVGSSCACPQYGWDSAPDPQEGHITYFIDGLYLGH